MASTTFSGPVTSTNGFIGALTGNVTGNVTGNIAGSGSITHATSAEINATATATAAQVAKGYITSTSAAATVITLPTGTLGKVYVVKDSVGDANTNPITVVATGSTIDSLASYVMNTPWGSISLIYNGIEWNVI